MRALPALLLLVAAATAEARPKADVVILWAPGLSPVPVEAAARDAGAAVIDRSPHGEAPLGTVDALKRAIAAFDAAQTEDAARLFTEVKTQIDQHGALELTETQLSDLFVYRALLADLRDDSTAAFDELVTAITVAPSRVLDPMRFPPRVREHAERARKEVDARSLGVLRVDVPAGCRAAVDGVALGAAQPRPYGTHWIAVTCAAAQPWGTRVELGGAELTVVARNTPIARPTPDEMLIQARSAGAAAFASVELTGETGVVRLIGADGRERDRRTVAVHGDLAPVADALRVVLAPAPAHRWYQSRWVWAAGAAAITAAVLIPVTAAVAGDTTAKSPTFDLGKPW